MAADIATGSTTERPRLQIVPRRRPGRWIVGALILLGLAMLGRALIVNPGFQWRVVWHYLFNPSVVSGVERTLLLTVVCMALGIVLGTVLAVMRLSNNPIARAVSGVYVWVLRAVPVLVQLLFWFYMAAIFPRLGLGIPFGRVFVSASSNTLIDQFTAAVLGLGLAEAAYMCEIIRAGILSVDEGQSRAAESLGLTKPQTFFDVIFPQAMRAIIPPTGNEVISMLKGTSQCIVIAYAELLTSVTLIYSRTFQTIPLLIVASIWYLFFTSVLTVIQRRIERHYGRGFGARNTRQSKLTAIQWPRRPGSKDSDT